MTTRPLTARAGGRSPAVPLAVAVTTLVTTTALALDGHVLAWEEHLFRWGNTGGPPQAVVWSVMQLGNLLAVPAVALLALAAHRARLAVEVAVGGTAAYLLARLLKELVDRGRPAELLADVELRGATVTGHGFPSGHAAVAVVLACLLLPHVRTWWRWLVAGAAVLVCLARVQVGAHLPLDVVGGAALGVACACTLLLAGGRGRLGAATRRCSTGAADHGRA